MTAGKNRWVLDASVGIKLFLPEKFSDQAEELVRRPLEDPLDELFVPDLFYVECANILWKHIRRFDYSISEARKDMAALKRLHLRMVPVWGLAEEALDLAFRLKITAYDACYVVLARGLEATLVTADEKLLARLQGGPCTAMWIGDIPLKRGKAK